MIILLFISIFFSLPLLLCFLSVPAAVSEVTVSNNGRTDFLSVSWKPAQGEFDNYPVVLKYGEEIVHQHVVSKSDHECVFNSLVPGRLYTISISTHSGSFDKVTIVKQRTREFDQVSFFLTEI